MKHLVPLASTLLVIACGTDTRNVGDAFGTAGASAGTTTGATGVTGGTSGGGDTDSGGGSDPSTSGADSGDDSGGTGPKFDIGSGLDIPGLGCDPDSPDCHCTAVDILFVVDNSGSMQEHAAGVKAAFDGFVEEMITSLPPETSLHVGITRATGFYNPGNSGGWNGSTCEAAQVDGSWNPPDVANNGINGQQGRLFEQDGKRYFELTTGQDAVPLKTWFGAALSESLNGFVQHSNTETVVAGAAYPFHPANATHNAGFLREKAVLVLFLLSDSSDLSPANVPTSDFVQLVSTAKAGCGDQCVLTTGGIPAQCYESQTITNTRIRDFMDGFGQPPVSYVDLDGSTPSFDGVLGTALAEVIKTTCESIPPVG